jgi:hypothetical protein
VGSCGYINEHLYSVKGRGFLDKLDDYELLKKDSSPCN